MIAFLAFFAGMLAGMWMQRRPETLSPSQLAALLAAANLEKTDALGQEERVRAHQEG